MLHEMLVQSPSEDVKQAGLGQRHYLGSGWHSNVLESHKTETVWRVNGEGPREIEPVKEAEK